MSSILKHLSANELLNRASGEPCELIQGEIRVMSPAGAEHGWTVAKLTVRLGSFVEKHQLGFVFGAETGFLLERNPDTVRAPDVSFVKADRIIGRPGKRYLEFAPDIAVEVISPGDTSSEVSSKAEQWLRYGTQMVWLVDPSRNSAAISTLEDSNVVTRNVQSLTAPQILPGCSLSLKSIFGI